MFNLILILIGALLFVVPLILLKRIFQIVDKSEIENRKYPWMILLIFVIFFFISYLAVVYSFVSGETSYRNSLLAWILFIGSIFVTTVSCIFYSMVKKMDCLIKKRTSALKATYKKSLDRAKEVQKLKDNFIFVAAHEIRGPVTAIKWGLENLREALSLTKMWTKEQLEILKDIESSNQNLVDLVDDLLDTSRIEYGTFKVQPVPFEIEPVIHQTIRELSYFAKSKKVEIQFEKPLQKLPQINADDKRTKEVLSNLLNNAIKFSNGHHIVKIKAEKINGKIRISVSDNGIGLSKQDILKLFKKFSRIETKATKDIAGTGLGLFLCKQIIDKMRGKIWAESEGRGKGSTFWFELPTK